MGLFAALLGLGFVCGPAVGRKRKKERKKERSEK
jgi:hypothetical protein